MVSMPSDSGITSSNSQSSALRLPASTLAWIAAPERHDLVRIEIGQRRLLEEFRHGTLHLRHARGAADHHHAFDVLHAQTRIAQRAARRLQGAREQILRHLVERLARERHVHHFAVAQHCGDLRLQHGRSVALWRHAHGSAAGACRARPVAERPAFSSNQQ